MFRLKMALVGALSLVSSLAAQGAFLFNRDCCGCFEVGGQALYWRPSNCDLNVAILDPRPLNLATLFEILPQGKMKAIDPDYEWGTRVFIGYTTCDGCRDIRVSYIYLHTDDRGSFRPPGEGGIYPVAANPNAQRLVPLFSSTRPGRALALGEGRARFDYDSVNLEFASRRMCRPCFTARSYAGLHFANIDRRFKTNVIGTALPDATISEIFEFTTRNHGQVWGVGPLIGGDFAYRLLPCFSLEGRIAAGVMAGDTTNTLFNQWSQTIVDQFGSIIDVFTQPGTISSGDRTLVVPHLATSLALSYSRVCGCFRLTGEIGWEFRTYINALDTVRFNDERGTKDTDCDSFRLNGLFFGLRVTL